MQAEPPHRRRVKPPPVRFLYQNLEKRVDKLLLICYYIVVQTNAPVAQLVEHMTFNHGVRSSILRRSTKEQSACQIGRRFYSKSRKSGNSPTCAPLLYRGRARARARVAQKQAFVKMFSQRFCSISRPQRELTHLFAVVQTSCCTRICKQRRGILSYNGNNSGTPCNHSADANRIDAMRAKQTASQTAHEPSRR